MQKGKKGNIADIKSMYLLHDKRLRFLKYQRATIITTVKLFGFERLSIRL